MTTSSTIPNLNILTDTINGPMLVNQLDSNVGMALQVYGEYQQQEIHLFQQIVQPGMVVVDAGAGIGQYTVPLARLVGPTGAVVAVEPQRRASQLLSANVSLSSLPNVHTFQLGLGKRKNKITTVELDYGQRSNLGNYTIKKSSTGSATVQVVPLDSLVGSSPVHLIRLDVEDDHLEVLEGSLKTILANQPVLYIRVDSELKSEQLVNFIYNTLRMKAFWHITAYHNDQNFKGNPNQIQPEGFFKAGNRLVLSGYSINLLCLPQSSQATVDLPEVSAYAEHPCREAYRSLLLPSLEILG